MKKIVIPILSFALMFSCLNAAFAQMSKQEKKEWKKKAKAYSKDLESLKTLVEENQSLNSQVSKLSADNNNLKSRMSDKDAKVGELEEDVTKLRADLSASKAEVRKLKTTETEASPTSSGTRMVKGVVFKVQIGAFRNKDLSKYFDNNENFSGETDADGMQKISLGQFTDYWEADTFKKYLREMGVRDAWIVPYKDGQRVPIKDVLEGVVAE